MFILTSPRNKKKKSTWKIGIHPRKCICKHHAVHFSVCMCSILYYRSNMPVNESHKLRKTWKSFFLKKSKPPPVNKSPKYSFRSFIAGYVGPFEKMNEFLKITLKLGHKNTNSSSHLHLPKEKLTLRNWNFPNKFINKREKPTNYTNLLITPIKKVIFTSDFMTVFCMFTSKNTPLLLFINKYMLIQLTKYSCCLLDQKEYI